MHPATTYLLRLQAAPAAPTAYRLQATGYRKHDATSAPKVGCELQESTSKTRLMDLGESDVFASNTVTWSDLKGKGQRILSSSVDAEAEAGSPVQTRVREVQQAR